MIGCRSNSTPELGLYNTFCHCSIHIKKSYQWITSAKISGATITGLASASASGRQQQTT